MTWRGNYVIMAIGYKTGGGDKDQPYNENTGKYEKSTKSRNTSTKKIGAAMKSSKAKKQFKDVTPKEWALWYQAIGDIELGVRYDPEIDGERYIQINNKIFISKTDYASPTVKDVIVCKNNEEADTIIEELEMLKW